MFLKLRKSFMDSLQRMCRILSFFFSFFSFPPLSRVLLLLSKMNNKIGNQLEVVSSLVVSFFCMTESFCMILSFLYQVTRELKKILCLTISLPYCFLTLPEIAEEELIMELALVRVTYLFSLLLHTLKPFTEDFRMGKC